MVATKCAIWNTPAELLESRGGEFDVYDSPRAGGQYWISGMATAILGTLTDPAKRLLTTWLCEQRRTGVEVPKVQSDVLDLIKTRRSLPVTKKLSAALLFIGENIKELGERIWIGVEGAASLQCMAETEAVSPQELYHLLEMLRDTGYLEGAYSPGGAANVEPTVGGWRELENMQSLRTDSSQAFVAMWFNESMTDAYVNGIAPAITQMGYKSMRVDKKEHNNKIDDEIVAEIRRSRFLVADFTCEPETARGGVYYEAGFAQGLGIPVIWTCKDTSIADLHFDTRQYAHIVWKTPADLLTQLKNRIGATIGDGPLPRSR